jgi:hypothetical protein
MFRAALANETKGPQRVEMVFYSAICGGDRPIVRRGFGKMLRWTPDLA